MMEFKFCYDLLNGVKFLENHGLKHGHLDPRNVVFTTPDFGFHTKIGFLQEIPNKHGDIYSLGRIFNFLLETAWDSSMEEKFLMWSVKRTPLRNKMIDDMDSILGKMIEQDDSKKFKSVKEICISVNPKTLDEETDSVGDIMHQLTNTLSGTSTSEWLGNFKFLNPLGEGGFGFVTKAYNKRNGEVTAVKTLICKNDQIERMAETEYNNIKFTFHRNLVRTHEIFERVMTIEELKSLQHRISDNPEFSSMLSGFVALNSNSSDDRGIKLICLEMEFCGHNLSPWLEHGENREDGVTQLLLIHDILEGVKFLHSKNIIHRDLKPENILFFPGRVFHAKIADFGFSKILPHGELSEEPMKCACIFCPCDCYQDLETTLTSNIGTALYRAPEVSSGKYGKPADLYSMGLIIFEILCVIQPNNRIRTLRGLKRMDYTTIDEKKANAFVTNGKSLIIALTQKEVINRIQSVEQIKLITIPGFVFQPKNILELETFLKFGVTSSRIELGRVNCQKTSLLHRNDTFAVECSFRFEGINIVEALSRRILGVELSLETGCVIKPTGVQDDKFIENNMDDVGKVNYFRLIFVHLQQRNITLDSLGWISPFTIEIEERLEFIGIAEFNVTSENLLSYDFGNARKVKLAVDVDRCIVPSKEEDFTTYQGGTLLRDLAEKCPMIRMEGKAHLLIE